MRGGDTVRNYFGTGIIVGFPFLVFLYLYVYNKIMEGAWFYVALRLWAWLMRRPFRATWHKMSWNWWQPDIDKSHYVYCLLTVVFYGYILYVLVPFWLLSLQIQLRGIMSRWALVREGSGARLPLGRISLILAELLAMLFSTLFLASQVWSHGKRFLAEVAYGTNRREKAIISVAAVGTMVALYFLPSPLALFRSASVTNED
jgi:hypothetical protein